MAIASLRSALAAIDNAEAPDLEKVLKPTGGHATLAGTVAGVGAAEVERRSLSTADLERLLHQEVTERDAIAQTYRDAGRADLADRVRAETDVLRAYIGPPPQG